MCPRPVSGLCDPVSSVPGAGISRVNHQVQLKFHEETLWSGGWGADGDGLRRIDVTV